MNAAPNFDRLARVYRWLELVPFGNALSKCRSSFLDELHLCRRALVLGDGDGRFTAQLLAVNPLIEIDAVDASPAMLCVLLERACDNRRRVRTWCGDVRDWQPTGSDHDLVVSHFFLDCLTTAEVERLAEKVRRCTCPAARWVISEFAVPRSWFGKIVAKPLVSGLYMAFGGLTGLRVRQLPQYAEAVLAQGFNCIEQRQSLGGLLVTELWSASEKRLLHSC